MDVQLTDPTALRLLSRTITLCSRFSDHVQLSNPPQTLSLRALTSSLSASFHLRLHASLFTTSTTSSALSSTKLLSRSLLPIFRLPQQLISLSIKHPPDSDIVTFTLLTRSRLTKTFRVPILDGKVPVAAFDKARCTGLIAARAGLLGEIVAHLHSRLDEVTITPENGRLHVASHVDDTANPANVMLRTEMTVAAKEFDSYTVGEAIGSPLTMFCKYLRAALDFCEIIDEPVKMWLERAGRPVMLEAVGRGYAADVLFDAVFVFATRIIEGEGGERGPDKPPVLVVGGGRSTGAGSAMFTATEVDVTETARRTDDDINQTQRLSADGNEQEDSSHQHMNLESEVRPEETEEGNQDFVEGTPPPSPD